MVPGPLSHLLLYRGVCWSIPLAVRTCEDPAEGMLSLAGVSRTHSVDELTRVVLKVVALIRCAVSAQSWTQNIPSIAVVA